MTQNNTAYQKVTDALIESLQRGVAPWLKPWSGAVPMNGETHRPYHGIRRIRKLVAAWTTRGGKHAALSLTLQNRALSLHPPKGVCSDVHH